MTIFTLTGVTGGAAILTGEPAPRDQVLRPDPLLVPALLFGDIRQTHYSISGVIESEGLVLGMPTPAIPNLLDAAAVLEGAWRLIWSSHGPVLGVPDLEAEASFVRLGDTDPNDQLPAVQFGRTLGVPEMPGTLLLGATISGEIVVTPVLSQSYNFHDLGDSPITIGVAVVEGALNTVGSRRSPPFALFDGTNFLARTVDDAVLNPSGAFTVSVTFDPELTQSGQDCVIVAKNNQTDTQAGWKITYALSTGLVTFTAYGAADGSISISRPTNTAIRTRSRLTAIVTAAGAITLYVNGATNQGTQNDVGVWVAPNASTEPFSMGCDEPTNAGLNRMKGAIYDFAFWSDEITGGDAALLLPDGLFPSTVDVTDLEVLWEADELQAALGNGTFAGWTDSVAALDLALGNPSGYGPIHCLVREAGVTIDRPPLLYSHIYSSTLFDSAAPDPDQVLTTTHRLSTDTRWRLWSQASITPQISSIFRQYRGDITITVMLSRVSGANTIIVAQFYGLRVEWQSANSLFVISGDDSVGSTNERHSYNVAFPNGRVEPTEHVVPSASAFFLTLRFNSFTKELDIFLNGTRNALVTVLTGQTAFEQHTGLLLVDFGDFRLCSIIPACLSDAQVLVMLAGFQPNAYASRPRADRSLWNPHPQYGVLDPFLHPFLDQADQEPIPFASSPTTVSGRLAYNGGGGIEPGSVRIEMPNTVPGTMAYQDNGAGVFVATLGAQPVASSSISYAGAQASGQVSLAAGQPDDGDTVTLVSADGSVSVTFEFDDDASFIGGNVAVVIGATAIDSASNLRAAINLNPRLRLTVGGSGTTVTLQHQLFRVPFTNVITVVGTNLAKTDFSGGRDPGAWSITITGGGLEFDQTVRGEARYFWLSAGLNPVPEDIPFDWIEMLLVQLYLSRPDPTRYLYADAPYIIKDGFDEDEIGGGGSAFIDPNPVIVSVTVNAAHVITAIANAGPTNAGTVISWWEVELISGSTEVMAVADYFQPNQFSVNRNHTDIFPIPPGQDWNEKRIRFVIQAVSDADQLWRSLFFRMLGEDFDNAPPEIIIVPGGTTGPGASAEDLLTTEERERLVIAKRARRPTSITPQAENSRYKTTKVFEGDRGRELGLMEVLDDLFAVGAEFRTHIVRSPDIGFLDRLAVLFYGEGFEWAWWALAYTNTMVDPDQEMFVGQRLIIPPRSALERFLARRPVTTLST